MLKRGSSLEQSQEQFMPMQAESSQKSVPLDPIAEDREEAKGESYEESKEDSQKLVKVDSNEECKDQVMDLPIGKQAVR